MMNFGLNRSGQHPKLHFIFWMDFVFQTFSKCQCYVVCLSIPFLGETIPSCCQYNIKNHFKLIQLHLCVIQLTHTYYIDVMKFLKPQPFVITDCFCENGNALMLIPGMGWLVSFLIYLLQVHRFFCPLQISYNLWALICSHKPLQDYPPLCRRFFIFSQDACGCMPGQINGNRTDSPNLDLSTLCCTQ